MASGSWIQLATGSEVDATLHVFVLHPAQGAGRLWRQHCWCGGAAHVKPDDSPTPTHRALIEYSCEPDRILGQKAPSACQVVRLTEQQDMTKWVRRYGRSTS